LFRKSRYRKGSDRFEDDLNNLEVVEEDEEDSDISIEAAKLPWLTDEEFLQKYRMSRESFSRLVGLIQDHPVFNPDSRTQKQTPVAHQLMVFLRYIGSEGTGATASGQRQTFAIGHGTSDLFRKRVTRAILSLRQQYLRWPNPEERRRNALFVHQKYGFPHCCGIADGTLMPLAFEPQIEDAPDYSGRKYGYSLSTMIICDHRKRIIQYHAGHPGSAHDNRVFKSTPLAKRPGDHLADNQYIVGDSAFENSWFMVSAFKKLPNSQLEEEQERFNTKLSRLRIISEHCIGILKGRFPWMRQIRMIITEDTESLRKILQLIDASVILHNILIEWGEDGEESWIDFDDFSDMDDAFRVPYQQDDELNQAIPVWMSKDTRLRRLLAYFKEHDTLFVDV
jgi:DDE superfamily endonuclease